MKKYLPVLMLLVACSETPTTETRVKQYMKDSVVTQFHDPASYEFVSMKVDTFTARKYAANLEGTDTAYYTSEELRLKRETIAELKKRPDSVLNLQVTVNYRAKNKIGALILDKTRLRYTDNMIQVID